MPLTIPDTELTALLERVARQDQAALRLLYDRVSGKLFGLALRVLRQREAAEDVLQDAFVSIWRNAPDYRAALSPPMAWMGLIVRSRALDALRRQRSAGAQQTQELTELMQETLESEAPNPMDSTDASQQARALHDCLQQLDGPQREVMSLAYLRELSHSELATQLKLPLGTVKTWIRRGLEKLRGCMAGAA